MSSKLALAVLGTAPPTSSYEKLKTFATCEAEVSSAFDHCNSKEDIKAVQVSLKDMKQPLTELLTVTKQATRDTKSALTAAKARAESAKSHPNKKQRITASI